MQTQAPRMDWSSFEQAAPELLQALRAASKAVSDSGLDKGLTELVKLRASQLNRCDFCLQFHLNLARSLGVDEAKLSALQDWREAALYDARERAALEWAEQLTRLGDEPAQDAAFASLQPHFGPKEVAHLSAAIAHINAWNRLAGGLRFTPPAAR